MEETTPPTIVVESFWKILQGVLTALMLGLLSWAWSLESRITQQEKYGVEILKLDQKLEGLEAKLDLETTRTNLNTTKIEVVEAEIRHIRERVDEIKALLERRR